MVAGSYFGEIEILFREKRNFDAVCENECEFYYLSRYVIKYETDNSNYNINKYINVIKKNSIFYRTLRTFSSKNFPM